MTTFGYINYLRFIATFKILWLLWAEADVSLEVASVASNYTTTKTHICNNIVITFAWLYLYNTINIPYVISVVIRIRCIRSINRNQLSSRLLFFIYFFCIYIIKLYIAFRVWKGAKQKARNIFKQVRNSLNIANKLYNNNDIGNSRMFSVHGVISSGYFGNSQTKCVFA